MNILSTTAGGVVKDVDWIERGLARELVRLGHDVESYSSISVRKVFPDAKPKETIDGIKVRRFNPLSPFSLLSMLKGEWDIIHANHLGYMAPISSYAAIRKKIKNIPLVFAVLGLYHDPFIVKDVQDPFANPINYKISNSPDILRIPDWFTHLPLYKADKIIALTNWEKTELGKFGVREEKIEVIPAGINLDKFKKIKSGRSFRRRHQVDGPTLIFVGQPIRRKGAEYLLRAMPEIIKEFENVKCVFAGYKKNKTLEDLCDHLAINSNVLFLGFLSEREKIEALRASDIFVFPTLYEGFGTVLLEAMAAGCPIVTTRVAGISEIVKDHDNGILVKPKSFEGISTAVKKLLSDKELIKKMSSKNKRDVKKYQWKHIAKSYEAVFEDTKRVRFK